jgi:hypothetical protein
MKSQTMRHPAHATVQASTPATQPPAMPASSELPTTKHLTQFEVARRWRLSHRTLERWRHGRQGPAYLKLGGAVVYRLEDVEAYEAAQRRAAAEQANAQLSSVEKFERGVAV